MKLTFLFLLFCVSNLHSSEGSCMIKLGDDKLRRPRLMRHLGSRKFPISYDSDKVIFFKNEIFDAYCATNLLMNGNQEIADVTFQCHPTGEIVTWPADVHYCYYCNNPDSLVCKQLSLTMFESSDTYEWCNNTELYGSFGLTINNNREKTKIAEICFEFGTRTPKVIKYFSVPQIYMDHNNLSMITDLWENEMSTIEFEYEGPFSFKNIEFAIRPEYFLEKENYEYHYLVQHEILYEMKTENPIAGVIWWQNLRVSNWKRYVDALSKQSESSIYKIYAGSGGKLEVPGTTLEGDFGTIPSYIWNILQEVNGSEEFVIIGYNSPYFDKHEDEIILCQDICHKITWLENIHKFFNYDHYGRMFCCSLDDALKTNILEGITL